jgi:hypothetical protein
MMEVAFMSVVVISIVRLFSEVKIFEASNLRQRIFEIPNSIEANFHLLLPPKDVLELTTILYLKSSLLDLSHEPR